MPLSSSFETSSFDSVDLRELLVPLGLQARLDLLVSQGSEDNVVQPGTQVLRVELDLKECEVHLWVTSAWELIYANITYIEMFKLLSGTSFSVYKISKICCFFQFNIFELTKLNIETILICNYCEHQFISVNTWRFMWEFAVFHH